MHLSWLLRCSRRLAFSLLYFYVLLLYGELPLFNLLHSTLWFYLIILPFSFLLVNYDSRWRFDQHAKKQDPGVLISPLSVSLIIPPSPLPFTISPVYLSENLLFLLHFIYCEFLAGKLRRYLYVYKILLVVYETKFW